MEEKSWRRRRGGEVVEENSWRRTRGGELMEENSWRRRRGGEPAALGVESAGSLSDKASDEETIDILPVLPVRVRQ